MRFAIINASVAAMFLCADQSSAQRGRGVNPSKYGWTFNFDSAKKTAKAAGKPIMLVVRCNP